MREPMVDEQSQDVASETAEIERKAADAAPVNQDKRIEPGVIEGEDLVTRGRAIADG